MSRSGWSESGGVYHEGLVDCCDITAFNTTLLSLKDRWNNLGSVAFSDRKSHKPAFYNWFVKWKAEDFRHCTLRSLREDIGLGFSIQMTVSQSMPCLKNALGTRNISGIYLIQK